MNRFLYILLLLPLFATCCKPAPQESTQDDSAVSTLEFDSQTFYGNIHRITKRCDSSGLQGVLTNLMKEKMVADFDRQGHLVRRRFYFFFNLIPTNDSRYSYDKQGNFLSQTDVLFGCIPIKRETCTYDERGNLLTARTYDDLGSKSLWRAYTYDDHDNLLCEQVYDADDVAWSKMEYIYDDAGRVLTTTYTSDRTSVSTTTVRSYAYDERGNVLSEWINGELQYEYTYDDRNNKTSVVSPTYSGKWEYVYDENGNQRESLYSNNYVHTRTLYFYDEQARLIGKLSYDNQDFLVDVYTYAYDANGNIIRRENAYSFDRVIRYDSSDVPTTCYDVMDSVFDSGMRSSVSYAILNW